MPEPESNSPDTDLTEAAAADAQRSAPQADGASSSNDLVAQLAAAKAEAAANLDRFLRASADMDNFRRRTVREKDELRATATGRVLEDVFPVLDNLALAINAAKQPNADLKSLVGGIEMVLTQLKSALAAH